MLKSTSFVSLCFLLALTGRASEALQWLNGTPVEPNQVTHICSGANFTFPWAFQLSPGEQLEDVKWLYTPAAAGGTPDLMANFIYGHFIAMPSFQDRLSYSPDNGGQLTVSGMTPADDGTYTMDVVTTHSPHSSGGYSAVQKDVLVQVLEAPSSIATSLSVAQQAVQDNVTGLWHVLLTCGQFAILDNQSLPVVTWTMPDGSVAPSSYMDQGVFYLRVASPVQSGDYQCHVAYDPYALRCLPPGTNSPQDASITLDAASERFLLLEARQDGLQRQNQELTSQLTQATAQIADMQRQMDSLQNCCDNPATTWSGSNNYPSSQGNVYNYPTTQGAYNGGGGVTQDSQSGGDPNSSLMWQNLTGQIADVDSAVQRYYAQCSKVVAFHAQASQQQYADSDHILFNEEVFYNHGNAFSPVTSEFVAPVSGVYVLMATTSAYPAAGATCNADLMVDDLTVARMMGSHQQNNYNQVTGHAVVHLNQGQRVWVKSIGDNTIDIRSLFSGFLLQPDA